MKVKRLAWRSTVFQKEPPISRIIENNRRAITGSFKRRDWKPLPGKQAGIQYYYYIANTYIHLYVSNPRLDSQQVCRRSSSKRVASWPLFLQKHNGERWQITISSLSIGFSLSFCMPFFSFEMKTTERVASKCDTVGSAPPHKTQGGKSSYAFLLQLTSNKGLPLFFSPWKSFSSTSKIYIKLLFHLGEYLRSSQCVVLSDDKGKRNVSNLKKIGTSFFFRGQDSCVSCKTFGALVSFYIINSICFVSLEEYNQEI